MRRAALTFLVLVPFLFTGACGGVFAPRPDNPRDELVAAHLAYQGVLGAVDAVITAAGAQIDADSARALLLLTTEVKTTLDLYSAAVIKGEDADLLRAGLNASLRAVNSYLCAHGGGAPGACL